MGLLQITHEQAGSATVGIDKNTTVANLIEEAIEGLELPGVASDYRLQQELNGKRLLVLASAIPQLKANSEIFLVAAPQKQKAPTPLEAAHQQAFPTPPASESPRLQSTNTTAPVKQENVSPPSLPLATGIRKLSHGRSKKSSTSSQASSAQTSDKDTTTSKIHAPRASTSAFAHPQPVTVPAVASTSNQAASPFGAEYFQTSAKASQLLTNALKRPSNDKTKKRKAISGDKLVFIWRLNDIPSTAFDSRSQTIGDIQIQMAALVTHGKTFVSAPRPDDFKIMHQNGRMCLPTERLDSFDLPCGLWVTCTTVRVGMNTEFVNLSVRHEQHVVTFKVLKKPLSPVMMISLFDRLAEIFPQSKLSPADYYLSHGEQHFDVFNNELLANYSSMFEQGKTTFAVHPMKPYNLNVSIDSADPCETNVDRSISIGGLLRRYEKEHNWPIDSRRVLIKARDVDPPSWFDLDQADPSEPFFRYGQNGDTVALEKVEWETKASRPKKKAKLLKRDFDSDSEFKLTESN